MPGAADRFNGTARNGRAAAPRAALRAGPRPARTLGSSFVAGAPGRSRITSIAILTALIVLAILIGATALHLRHAQNVSAGALLEPVAVAAILALLLIVQGRQAAAAARAFADSEERFRLAVEAARCGIWEWDLRSGDIFMSEVTGVMLGWGGGGVVAADEVLARVAPEHRERVRQALAAAALHGAFDVSFRAQWPEGGSTVWIDARGQAPGRRSGPGGEGETGDDQGCCDSRGQARAASEHGAPRDDVG